MALMSKTEVDKTLARVGKSLAAVRKDIQSLAVTAVGYSLQHGDVTIGQRLLDTMNKSVRKDSLVAYLEKHGAFAYSKTEKRLMHYKREDVTWDADYEAAISELPWDEAKREPEIVSKYDVSAEFDKFMKRMDKLAGDANIILAHKDLLAQLQNTVAMYHAREVLASEE